MSKTIALFFDGTWEKRGNTNVHKLHKALPESKASAPNYYIKGVGADFWNHISGGLGGRGISGKIREGYEFLVKHYLITHKPQLISKVDPA